ncbi:MAG: taurine dioxygenase [Gammaproteobacteria bacterium]|nr:taurine dioxygenase [Gammaproteobacteria bacterium]
MGNTNLGIRPLTPHLGAVVEGIDLSEPLSSTQLDDIRRAFRDWSVLVFRDQRLERTHHKAFARHFGTLHVHPLKAAAGYEGGSDPEVLPVKTTATSKYTAGDGWHTDVTCDEEPPMGSMLYITEVPPHGGGDTLFANMYRAFDSLSASLQGYLETLTAVHDGARPYMGNYGYSPPAGVTFPKNEHPVVIRHPETDRKVLFVNSGFTTHIKGLKPAESRALLDFLFGHIATTPALTCRVAWQPNTLTFWDNRCTQHHAVWDYFPETRYGERVSIVGERPRA